MIGLLNYHWNIFRTHDKHWQTFLTSVVRWANEKNIDGTSLAPCAHPFPSGYQNCPQLYEQFTRPIWVQVSVFKTCRWSTNVRHLCLDESTVSCASVPENWPQNSYVMTQYDSKLQMENRGDIVQLFSTWRHSKFNFWPCPSSTNAPF